MTEVKISDGGRRYLPAMKEMADKYSKEAIQLLNVLKRDDPRVWQFVIDSFQGLPTSFELEEEARSYFSANSSISAAVITNPGSSVISEILYDQRPTLSFIDTYFLQSKAGRSVLARLIAVEEKLLEIIENYRTQKQEIMIGNLGSGPGRDIINILATHYRDTNDVRVVNIDVDEMALRRGEKVAQSKRVDHLIQFRRADFLRYSRHNSRMFDILLLIGVICPLDMVICTSYLQVIKRLLKPNGCLVASNVSKKMLEEDPFTYHIMSRLGNWTMSFKDEAEMQKIFEEGGYTWRGYFTDEYGFHIMGIGIADHSQI